MCPPQQTSQHSFTVALDIDPEPDLEVFFVSRSGVELRNPLDRIEDVFGGIGESLKQASLSVEEAANQFTNNMTFNMTFKAPAGGSYTISTAGASFGIGHITDA